MATLTSLPIYLQSRILMHLCDDPFSDEQILRRAKFHGIKCCIPLQYQSTQITLDDTAIANTPLPSQLLSAALASPVLAAAALRLVPGGVSFLTDIKTNGQLSLWVKAFAAHVQAISIADVGEVWKDALPDNLRKTMVANLCRDTVDLFREISLNIVRLKVLDLVHVPFDKCDSDRLRDALMTGLCSALESCQSTVRELALPVCSKSDICSRALEAVTLPYLTILSIELKHVRSWERVSSREGKHLGYQFLRMMQAVDGHADRLRGVTTLEELRLINLRGVPCTSSTESGCSRGFFHAIKTLRVSSTHPSIHTSSEEVQFLYLFRSLEYLYWTGKPENGHRDFEIFCKGLKELHFCHHHWIKGPQIDSRLRKDFETDHVFRLMQCVRRSQGKVRTLVCYSGLFSHEIRTITNSCPNLRYLSLYVTRNNVSDLGRIARKCKLLTGLEILIHEIDFRRLGKDEWVELGNAIPRDHANLRELAIQKQYRNRQNAVRMSFPIDCLANMVERMGSRLERLVFRVTLRIESWVAILRGLRRIIDTCLKHSTSISYLRVDIVPRFCIRSNTSCEELVSAVADLRSSTKTLILSRKHLGKMDFGMWHTLLSS